MTSPDPWLSVLLPVYNGATTLGESLASVANEKDDGIEVILVDQNSTDASIAIAESFADRMTLRIESAPQNRNWMQNTNLALTLARAPVCTMLHQDDYWLPGRAARAQAQLRAMPDPALWISPARFADPAGRCFGRFAPPFGENSEHVEHDVALGKILVQNTIALPSALFSTEAARALGGLDEGLWYTADWDLWLKLADRAGLGWDPTPSSAFRVHAQSQTARGSRDADDFRSQLEIPVNRHIDKLPPAPRQSVERFARLSNRLNVALAGKLHGSRDSLLPLAGAILGLGPARWLPFMRDTQILRRILPRLRVLVMGRSGR